MTDNEFFEFDRITKIQSMMRQYAEENFSISYSGGADSNVLSTLFDLALPENKIPRVYCDTGIELKAVSDFVKAKAAEDDRFIIIRPKVPIKKMLEEVGYPFKSKEHSMYVKRFQKAGKQQHIRAYLGECMRRDGKPVWRECPKILRYQFTNENTLKISDLCCDELKKKPLAEWQKEHGKPYPITGIRRSEGGHRRRSQCTVFRGDKLQRFNPIVLATDDWCEWFIKKHDIKLPIVYYPPYSFNRTGCKGCPFAVDLQRELDILKEYFPNEYKQCEAIWKPVYEEYRRIGYRLKLIDNQISFKEYDNERMD